MALRISWQAPLSYFPTNSQPKLIKPQPKPFCALPFKSTITTTTRRKGVQFLIKATEEKDLQSIGSDESVSESESESVSTQQGPSSKAQPATEVDSLSELGSEIKKAMRERDQRGGGGEGKDGDFWGGVAEEIKEIEWPAFGKVLRTTGVVIGVIAGSSVVLLTVNAVLAELSDRVFVGRGVQDFFS